ncbi:MAG TPA: DMT family transporter [Acidimicrobiales bacterium]|nr:DMT family transporter [Acidimicrobiales bacterium]
MATLGERRAIASPALARILVLGAVWGTSFLFIRVADRGFSPAQVVQGRLVFGALALGLFMVAGHRRLPRQRRLVGHLVVMGVVANVVPFLLIAWGETRVSSSLAAVLNASTPIMTVLLALLVLPAERPTPLRAAGIAAGLGGVVLVMHPWSRGATTGSLVGELACVGAALCYGVTFVYTRRFISPLGAEPVGMAAAQIGSGAVMLGLLAPALERSGVHAHWTAWLSLVALGAVNTGVAYVWYFQLTRATGAAASSMVTYVSPVVAVVLGAAVLGESLGWELFVGGAVVLAGVAMAQTGRS